MSLSLDTSRVRMPRYAPSMGQKCTGADKYVVEKRCGIDGSRFQ